MDATSHQSTILLTGLFDQYHIEIFGYLCKLLRDRQLAEDLLQETFLRAFGAPELTRLDNPRAWLYRIATNLALNAVTRRQRFAWLPWSAARRAQIEARDPGQAVEARSAVDRALAHMMPELVSILLLYAHFGWTISELSDMLGISPEAVRTRLHRARELFRKEYTKGEPL